MDIPRDIGSRLELFVDDWLIERMNGVRLKMHRPVLREIALEFNRPWEGPISWAPVVMKEGDLYRLWYRARRETGEQPTAYAKSADGIRWERPELGLFTFEDSRANNIVWQGPGGNMAVFRQSRGPGGCAL